MANRILRDWTDSDKVNLLSAEAERFFTRLIMKADDFGYFHAHPSLLIAALFPLKIESVKSSEIDKWIRECEFVGLIYTYEVNERKYLQIKGFKQRLRNMVSKFPRPADNPPPLADNPLTLRGQDADNPPLETKGSRNEDETKGKVNADTHLLELNNNETTQMSFRRTVKGKFPVFTSSQFESIMTGYLGYFDGKYPNGDTWNTFTKAFAWYISDLRQLPESVKKIKTLGE